MEGRKRFYNQKKWIDKRNRILRRDGFMDQLELRAGRRVPADMVHHILPREQYPEYAYADWNLISLSDESHRELHTIYGDLSEAGKKLMHETAKANGIKLSHLTLIIGLPGTGKTTLCKRIKKDGLVYDLDYISAAFCLSLPGRDNKQARKMANSMAKAFALNVRRYTQHGYIIRTAPVLSEVEAMEPDKVIICNTMYKPENLKKIEQVEEKRERIEIIKEWAIANGIEVTEL